MLRRRRIEPLSSEDNDAAESRPPKRPRRTFTPWTGQIFDAKPSRAESQVAGDVSKADGRFFVAVLEWHPSEVARWQLLHEPPRAVKDAVAGFHGLLSPLFDEKMRALAQTMRNHNGRSVIGFALMRSWSFKEAPARNALDIALRNVLDQHSQRRRSTAPRCTLRHEVVKSVFLDKPLFLLEDDKSTAKEVWNSCKDIRRANISQIADVECFMFPETIQFLFNFQCSIVGTVVVACRIVPPSASGTLWFHFPFENRFCKLFLCQYSRTM